MTKQNRREFLRDAIALGAGASVSGGLAGAGHLAQAADGDNDRYYVFCYFNGGWDVLLSLDPRDPAVFTDDGIRDHRIQPAYDLTDGSDGFMIRPTPESELQFGPFIGDLAEHWERLAVVRGISMETLAHQVGRRRFITGKAPSGLNARGSSMGTWLAANTEGDQPIPQLSVGVETYNQTSLPSYANALRVSDAGGLVTMLQMANPALSDVQLSGVVSLLQQEAECDRSRRSAMLRDWSAARARAQLVVDSELYSYFQLGAETEEMAELRDRYGITNANQRNASVRCAIAAQALMNGVSRCVSLNAAGGLDTHFGNWTTDQGRRQRDGFNAVSALARHLSSVEYKDTGRSWLDVTTIVGFSEFSRTPLLNQSGGRDHHITNSCFLLGGHLTGNKTIGASSDVGMNAQTVNLSTGRVDPGGEIIRPEHVLRTLYVDAGIEEDAADLRVDPISALLRS